MPRMRVAEALAADVRLVDVRGPLVVGRDGKQRICTALRGESPPTCVHPSIVVHGMRDLSAFDRVDAAEGVQWVRGVAITGRLDGRTLHIPLTCRTQRVIDYFEDATGDRLTVNPFLSGEPAVVDFATLLEDVPTRLVRKYGLFRIGVRNETEPLPFADDIGETKPDERGIRWWREESVWIALTYYDDRNVALAWIAGDSRRVDDRWERLDAILRDL